MEKIKQLIGDFRAIAQPDSITPETVGYIFDAIASKLGVQVQSLDFLYKTLDTYFTKDIDVAATESGVKMVLHQYDPVDDSTENVEVDFPMASSAGAGAMSAEQAQILERLAQHGLTSLSLKRNEAGVLVLEYSFYNPATGRETKEVQVAPLATAAGSGFMTAAQAKTVSDVATASRAFLAVGPDGELVAHGVGPFLKQGLTPVLFRRLRRSNQLTNEATRIVEHRWTRFTKLADAVNIDPDTGAVSFRTDLLDPSAAPTDDGDVAPRTTDASALLLNGDTVVYGQKFFTLDTPAAWRMLVFDFILGFVDLTDEKPARRWTLADTPVRLPFRVRFTPTFHYEDSDEILMHSATAHFGFDV